MIDHGERIQRADWHVVTRTEGGAVSILKNLDLKTAVKARQRLKPRSEVLLDQVRANPGRSFGYTVQSSDIIQSDIIGPDEWDGCTKALFHIWMKVRDEEANGFFAQLQECNHCAESRVVTLGLIDGASQ